MHSVDAYVICMIKTGTQGFTHNPPTPRPHTHTHTHIYPVLMSKLGCLWPTIVHWHWGIAGLSEGPWWIPTRLRPPIKVWEEKESKLRNIQWGRRRWQKIVEYTIQRERKKIYCPTHPIQMHRCVCISEIWMLHYFPAPGFYDLLNSTVDCGSNKVIIWISRRSEEVGDCLWRQTNRNIITRPNIVSLVPAKNVFASFSPCFVFFGQNQLL